MSQHTSSTLDAVTRRRAVAIGGSAVLASTAGCSTVLDAVGSRVLEEVNVLNQLTHEVSGSIEVTDPAGETVLDDSFDVPSTESDGESNVVAYADVWTTPGTYRVEMELTDTVVGGVSRVDRRVSIDDTEDELVALSVGSGDESEPIAVRVGESFSDLGRPNGTG
jgi:hypothetical protein